MSADLLVTEAPALEDTEAPTVALDAAATTDTGGRPLDAYGRMVLAVMEAANEHPQLVGALTLAIPMLAPTDPLMEYGHVQLYDSHVAELIGRIVRDEDLTLPTSAEILVVCSAASLKAPLDRSGYALFCSVFREVFPDHPLTNEIAGDWWHHANRDGGDELRRTLTRSMQNRIANSNVRGKREIAAWRAEAGLPARRMSKPKQQLEQQSQTHQ